MTVQEKRALLESLDQLEAIKAAVAMLFYGKLLELAPQARKEFSSDLRSEGERFMDRLLAAARSAAGPAPAPERLIQLGSDGRSSVLLRDTAAFKSALLWAIAQALQPAFPQDARAAWKGVIDVISATAANRVGEG